MVVVDAGKIEDPEVAGAPKTDPVTDVLANIDPDLIEAGVPKSEEVPPNTEDVEVAVGAPPNNEPPDAGAPNEEPNKVA